VVAVSSPAPSIGSLVGAVADVGHAAPAADPQRAPTVTIPRAKRAKLRRRRGRWIAGTFLALLALASAAWGAWAYVIPHNVDVPRVVRTTVDQATARLTAAGLRVHVADGVYSMKFAPGTVVRMQPKAGTTLREGSTVTLIPSKGPPPVPVPDLTGMTIAEAQKALAQAHLTLGTSPTRKYSDTGALDKIIGQSVPFGENAPKGSPIDVVVSKGPFPQPVPKVVGKTKDQADSILTTAGFLVDVQEKYSDSIPRDEVIAQKPDPKTKLQPGKTVTIVVSLGPKSFPMPNVVGMSKDAAVAKLKALGLHVGVLTVLNSSGATVVSQIPSAGVTVRHGQTVTIYVA